MDNETKVEIIKPNEDPKKSKFKSKSILTPIIYLILGILLAFKSNEAVKIVFYILGILVIIYGIKSLVTYFKFKEQTPLKNINLTIAITSLIIGALLILLSNALEISIRYIIGFFLIYMGVSRFLTQFSLGTIKSFSSISNLVLIILGIYSIFFSNVVLVIIGWVLIVDAIFLIWDYIRK